MIASKGCSLTGAALFIFIRSAIFGIMKNNTRQHLSNSYPPQSVRGILQNLLKLIRPYQYTKNLFIFLPAFFDFRMDDPQVVERTLAAFAAFSMAASAVYIFNDWMDREEDALHPGKKHRPLAAGYLAPSYAFMLMGLLLAGTLLISSMLSPAMVLLTAGYVILNGWYSWQLKHIPILDVTVIGLGFVIRLMVGSDAADVSLSPWIIVLTFLLALFLSFAKRRDDILLRKDTSPSAGKPTVYSLKFIDSSMVMTASIVVVAYVLWTFSTEISDRLEQESLYLTSLFVILGILRYMYITFVEEKSGNPSLILLRDRFLQLVLTGWLASLIWILYV